jgi:hypothetical protein
MHLYRILLCKSQVCLEMIFRDILLNYNGCIFLEMLKFEVDVF